MSNDFSRGVNTLFIFLSTCRLIYSFWEPAHPKKGVTGSAVVVPEGGQQFLETDKHVLVTAATSKALTLSTYAGACWSKSGQFASLGEWQTYVAEFAKRVARPVVVKTRR